jgi:hypothetical protein
MGALRWKHEAFMRDNIVQAIQSTHELRAALCTHWVADLDLQMRAFLSQLNQIILLFESQNPQNARLGMVEDFRRLRELGRQLAASGFEYKDNVRCMDDLQYEILPVLERLLKNPLRVISSPTA